MKSIWSHIILRSLVISALIFQSLMPASLAIAKEAGLNVSSFICSPSDRPVGADTQTQITELITALTDSQLEDTPQITPDQCSNCVLNLNAVLTTPQKYLTTIHFQADAPEFIYTRASHVALARGPPLGGRAPPISH